MRSLSTTLPGLKAMSGVLRQPRIYWLVVLVIMQQSALLAQSAVPPAPEEPVASATTVGLLNDRPIGSLKASLAAPTENRPADTAETLLRSKAAEIAYIDCGRPWCLSPYEWDAPNTKSLPLYFEEPELERMGYYYGKPQDGTWRRVVLWPLTAVMADEADEFWLKQRYFQKEAELDCNQPQLHVMQPLVSAANFYGRVVMLPYMWGVHHPKDAIYDLGEDNPGSPVPYRKRYVPLSVKGALFEGAAFTGLGFLLP